MNAANEVSNCLFHAHSEIACEVSVIFSECMFSFLFLRFLGLAEDLPLRDEPLLCTVFSASNYRGSNNDGAVLKLMRHPFTHSLPVYREAFDSLTKEMRLNRPVVLHYGVKRFKTSEAFMRLEDRKCSSLLGM